jgi:hypothetical protein
LDLFNELMLMKKKEEEEEGDHQLVDVYYDLPGSSSSSSLLTVCPAWPGGRWLRCRVERATGRRRWRLLRSCHAIRASGDDDEHQHTRHLDMEDHDDEEEEETILAQLFPDVELRPASLADAGLVMLARIPAARTTIDLEGRGARIILECALLAPDLYVLRATIVARDTDVLESVRASLLARAVPAGQRCEVVLSIRLRNPQLYARLLACGVVRQEDVGFDDDRDLLVKEPPLDMGYTPSRSSMAAQERQCEAELQALHDDDEEGTQAYSQSLEVPASE